MTLKNLRIRSKFMVGFGSILILLTAVASWSVLGIGSIVGDAEEVIDGNKLRGDFIQRIVDHLKWAEKVNSFINDKETTELNVEIDPHKCAFGKWYYGEARTEAEHLVPAIAPLMKEIEEPHAALHASAQSIKDTNVKVDVELFAYFQAMKAAHLEWLNSLMTPIADPTLGRAQVEEDGHKCGLGTWLYSDKAKEHLAGHPELAAKLEPIYEPHEQLHASATEINRRLRMGDHGGALQYYTRVTKPLAAQTIAILDDIIAYNKETLDKHDEAQRIFTTVTIPNLNKVQDILNTTREVVAGNIMTDEVMLQEASSTKTAVSSISGLAILIGVALGMILCKAICAPLVNAVRLTMGMAEGDFTQRLDEDRKDELGDLAKAVNTASSSLEQRTLVARAISKGDLTQDIVIASDKDELGKALDTMIKSLREIIGNIIDAATNVEAGSSQVSQSSVALSQGTTEQAASSEQINSSMTEISGQTKANAENAAQANDLAQDARETANKNSKEMEQMVEAMDAITASSDAIGKIIKVIDEIAFQTNLLALNAAVEAARAGRHGKGFAVVAEEVRNLAGRSAQAAQETTTLIEGSSEKVKKGAEIASTAAESFTSILEAIGHIADLVQRINEASTGQADSIGQINLAMGQMDQVTQGATANAEETAASAEELSSQAQLLRQMISHFKLEMTHGSVHATSTSPLAIDTAPTGDTDQDITTEEFGRY